MSRVYSFIFFLIFSLTVFGQNIEVHLCGGHVTDISLFSDANCCCLTPVKATCGNQSHVKFSTHEELHEKSCCNNVKHSTVYEAVAPQYTSQTKVFMPFVNVRVFTKYNTIPFKFLLAVAQFDYDSPKLTPNPQTLFQCFRI